MAQGELSQTSITLCFPGKVLAFALNMYLSNATLYHVYTSPVRFLGPQRIMSIQRFYGAKLYFNTLVPWGEGKIKYGVIDRWERKYIESLSQ